MQTNTGPASPTFKKPSDFIRRIREFSLIGRDPVLSISLILSGIIIGLFVVYPLFRSMAGGFFNKEGAFDITYFARYFDDYFGPALRRTFTDTMQMGLYTATSGTLVGFIFAYAVVRCRIPGKRFVHWLALLPRFPLPLPWHSA